MNTSDNDIYEILAAYFVSIIYNKLYPIADRYRNDGKYATRTEAYKHVVRSYLVSIIAKPSDTKTRSNCDIVMKEICDYYNEKNNSSFLHNNVIEAITNVFITRDFRNNFNLIARVALLRKVIIATLKGFIADILEPKFLNKIIDGNDVIDTNNARLCQNAFIARMKVVQQSYTYKFDTASINVNDKNKDRTQQMKKLLADLSKLQVRYNELNERNGQYKDAYKKLRKDYAILEDKYKALKAERSRTEMRQPQVEEVKDDSSFIVGNNTVNQAIEQLSELNESDDEVDEFDEIDVSRVVGNARKRIDPIT